MRMYAFSVFDSAVSTYSPPFFVRANGFALRDFRLECLNPESRLSKSPGDYTLFALGVFDDESGMFFPDAAPQRVMSGLEAVSLKEVANGQA